jgi:hypothetical protein
MPRLNVRLSTIHLTLILFLASNVAVVAAQLAPRAVAQDNGQIEILQSDPSGAARQEAARWLGLRGGVTAVAALAQAAAFDADRQVRIAAGDSIALIRRRAAGDWAQRPRQGGGDRRALVENWYQLYLRRPADPTGLADCLTRLRGGSGVLEVQAFILASEEYFRLHGSRQGSWVAGLYADVLDRSPSPREIQHWNQLLNQAGGSREQTATDFLNAAQAELAQNNRPR